MKKLLLVAALLCSALSFSQVDIKIDKKIEGDAYARIFPDGTSVIHFLNGKHTYQYSYDENGKLLHEKEQEVNLIPDVYSDKDKVWACAYFGYRNLDVYIGDFEGNVTKTTLKHKIINGQRPKYNVSPDGKLEILITNNKPSHSKYEEGLIDYVVLQYDPKTKAFNFIDYTDIPNIQGSTAFIGQKGGERHFVNWFKVSKGLYKFQVMAVDEKKNVRTFAPVDFRFDKQDGIFVGGSMVNRRFGWEEYDDNIYYAIHCFSIREKKYLMTYNFDYTVYRVKENGENSSFLLKVPLEYTSATGIVHFPLYVFPEDKEGENAFYVTDGRDGLELSTDFSTSKIDPKPVSLPSGMEVYNLRDVFPGLYEASQKKLRAESAFRLCDDNNARLLIKTEDNQFTLYEEKVP